MDSTGGRNVAHNLTTIAHDAAVTLNWWLRLLQPVSGEDPKVEGEREIERERGRVSQ